MRPLILRLDLLSCALHHTCMALQGRRTKRAGGRRHGAGDLGFARLDLGRHRRCGVPEVIFCEGKTPAQVIRIIAAMQRARHNVFGTRATPEFHAAVARAHPDLIYHADARAITLRQNDIGLGQCARMRTAISNTKIAWMIQLSTTSGPPTDCISRGEVSSPRIIALRMITPMIASWKRAFIAMRLQKAITPVLPPRAEFEFASGARPRRRPVSSW